MLSIGSLDGSEATRIIEIPGLLSFLATGTFDGDVEGINELQVSERAMAEKVAAQYGPHVAALVLADDYAPNIPLTYWSFRFMMGLGFAHHGRRRRRPCGRTRKGRVPAVQVVGPGWPS